MPSFGDSSAKDPRGFAPGAGVLLGAALAPSARGATSSGIGQRLGGAVYRQVDCKYIYNLDVSSLRDGGRTRSGFASGGVNLAVAATFDLR